VRGDVVSASAPEAVIVPASLDSAPPRPTTLDDVEPEIVMPRVQGMALRQALEALAPFDVRLEISGRGIVVNQVPSPGTPLESGSPCRLELASRAADR